MKSVKIHLLLFFLLLALALTCVISPWMALGADWAAARWPDLLEERVPFARVFNRGFMIAGITLFIVGRRHLIPAEIKSLLAVKASIAWQSFMTGSGLALGSMAFLLAVMTAADVYTPFFRLSLAQSLSRIASALATGVFVGFIEEVFFRGMLFLGLLERGRPLRAYGLANVFYSALHFVKPGEDYFLDRLDLLAGFRHLLTTFQPFFEPATILPGLIGLFLTGVVLSYALARTGNLYLSIGLHAGWVIALKTIRVFGDYRRQDLGRAFGSTDPKIVSGVATWIGILLVGLVITRLTRPGSQLATGQPPVTAA
ncbi:MAG: lysostaphin resistance A-like protein [Candidatus Binatia bacterium]